MIKSNNNNAVKGNNNMNTNNVEKGLSMIKNSKMGDIMSAMSTGGAIAAAAVMEAQQREMERKQLEKETAWAIFEGEMASSLRPLALELEEGELKILDESKTKKVDKAVVAKVLAKEFGKCLETNKTIRVLVKISNFNHKEWGGFAAQVAELETCKDSGAYIVWLNTGSKLYNRVFTAIHEMKHVRDEVEGVIAYDRLVPSTEEVIALMEANNIEVKPEHIQIIRFNMTMETQIELYAGQVVEGISYWNDPSEHIANLYAYENVLEAMSEFSCPKKAKEAGKWLETAKVKAEIKVKSEEMRMFLGAYNEWSSKFLAV